MCGSVVLLTAQGTDNSLPCTPTLQCTPAVFAIFFFVAKPYDPH